jgi:DNA (cytosine-5)-methyltransferase 1
VADTDSGGLTVDGERNGGQAEPRLETSRRDDPDGGDATAGLLPVPVPYVDVLCGGFPCQDISVAGRGAGLAGERSGLWREFARLIGELRPRYVIVENVPALTSRGLGVVLGDLASMGYRCRWGVVSAENAGAVHKRERIWILAELDPAA